MQLIPVHADHGDRAAHALLIVPPWINKFYILDLKPGKILHQMVRRSGRHGVRDLLGQSGTRNSARRPSTIT